MGILGVLVVIGYILIFICSVAILGCVYVFYMLVVFYYKEENNGRV
jgi:hypothetical protein